MATKYTKRPLDIPNGSEIDNIPKWQQNIPNGHYIFQMAVK
jgi:hypothetical protein